MFLYAIYGVDIFVDFYLWQEATGYSPECSYFSRHPEGLSFSGLRSEFLRHPEGLSFRGTWKVREQEQATSTNGTQGKLHILTQLASKTHT